MRLGPPRSAYFLALRRFICSFCRALSGVVPAVQGSLNRSAPLKFTSVILEGRLEIPCPVAGAQNLSHRANAPGSRST